MHGHTTLPEGEALEQKRVRLLTYVLCYDDLLRPESATFFLPSKSEITLGRSEDDETWFHASTGLRIADRWMSRQHAVIAHNHERDMVRDLGSRNGTYINGQKIASPRELADGDLIEVGHSLLCYRVVDSGYADALSGERRSPQVGPTTTFSPEMAMFMRDLRRIAPSRESVLLLAETGAGKEIAAGTIHEISGRKGAFCAVDCGAIPDSLFESTFFGHQKGAFTGATEARQGEIVRADQGTLFLDEIGNMSPTAQAKLLRVIETGMLTPLGASTARTVDVRWVAATNRELFQDDGFRSDLLRRVAGYVGRIPPLRRRREDLGVLSAHLLHQASVERASITAPAGRALFSSRLSGNIRQLRTALRSGAVLAGDGPIDVSHLSELEPDGPDGPDGSAAPKPEPGQPQSPKAAKKRPSADEVARALALTQGNVVRAAEVLGTHPRQVYRWLKRYSLSLDRFRG